MNRKTSGKKVKKKKKNKFLRIILRYVCLLALFALLASGAFVFSVYCGLWGKLPDYAELRSIRNDEASILYSENGEMLGKYYIENRTNVGFDHIPPHAVNALIATEDARFYNHQGIDKMSLLRVLFKTLLLGDHSSGGGSTISQQLAKNLYPREEQQVRFMPVVKLKEMFTAHRLENIYNKDEILTLYLNTVEFGENTFGIESAAQKYFSVTAAELTIPQAAVLVGMLKGPSRYNPRLHPERALQRRNTVIALMVKNGFLPEEDGQECQDSKLELSYKPVNPYSGPAPYLREKIRHDATDILNDYNTLNGTSYNLYKDGLILTTTIDAEMQRYAENAVRMHMRKLQDSYYKHLGKKEPWDSNPAILTNAIRSSRTYRMLKNSGLNEAEIMKKMNERKKMTVYSIYQGETERSFSAVDSIKHYLKILQPGLIAVDPRNGKIKAWVGGPDYKYFQYDQVDASRQVGSVFKPVVYCAALTHGARPDAYYENAQKTYSEYDDWTPRNSDNRYEGFYTLKGALSHSVNTIAVEVLLQTGIDTVISQAHRMGIRSDLPPYPSLALGVAEIPLKEMVQPFACFANNGRLADQYYLEEIRDKSGKVLYKATPSVPRAVIAEDQATQMSDMLAAVINEGTGQRLRTDYNLHNEMAGKTGTTQNQADGLFIGYNPRIVVGIRVGANNPDIHFNSTSLGQGARMAMPIFGEFMQQCLKSPSFSHWSTLTFPLVTLIEQKEQDYPVFKDHLNLFDRMSNRKLEKITLPEKPVRNEEEGVQKEKKGFFRRLFRKDR